MNPRLGLAAEQIQRVMSAGVGGAGAIFAAIKVPELFPQASVFGIPWTIAATASFLLPAVVLAPLSIVAPLAVLRSLAALCGAGFLVTSWTVPAVLPHAALPPGAPGPWPFTISALATSVVAVWLPRWVAWAYLLLAVATTEGVRFAISPGADLRVTLLDTSYTLLFGAVFVSLALMLASIARRLDVAMDAATTQTRAVASANARAHERERTSALVHDRVLVTLLTAADPDPERRKRAIRLADQAVLALTSFDGPPSTAVVPARELAWRIQSIATELCPDAVFGHAIAESSDLPAPVAEAIIEAAGEALRNTVRHAGADASRAVHIEGDERRVEVTVIDDGRGFDSRRVAPDRLGISVSIRARMASVAGGAAIIVSTRGVGTRVTLRWSAP